jgi:predicted transcriptional regulator
MSRNAQIILALDKQRLNAYELSANLGCDLHAVRNSVQDLLLRCLITSSAKRVKFYSLTTLGQMEADRLRELGATCTKTPESVRVASVAPAGFHSLQAAWGRA